MRFNRSTTYKPHSVPLIKLVKMSDYRREDKFTKEKEEKKSSAFNDVNTNVKLYYSW